MSKAEKFIGDCTRNCSNEFEPQKAPPSVYNPWLTPDEARKAVEIAREETLQDVKRKLLSMLQISIDNQHFFELLDNYIEELKTNDERL